MPFAIPFIIDAFVALCEAVITVVAIVVTTALVEKIGEEISDIVDSITQGSVLDEAESEGTTDELDEALQGAESAMVAATAAQLCDIINRTADDIASVVIDSGDSMIEQISMVEPEPYIETFPIGDILDIPSIETFPSGDTIDVPNIETFPSGDTIDVPNIETFPMDNSDKANIEVFPMPEESSIQDVILTISGLDKVYDDYGNRIPYGFKTLDDYKKFTGDMKKLFPEGTSIYFQGSSVTGIGHSSGLPFDCNRTSDFDIAIVNDDIFIQAMEEGYRIKTDPNRIGPLNKKQLEKLGLLEAQNILQLEAARDVHIMLFESDSEARRRPTIEVFE